MTQIKDILQPAKTFNEAKDAFAQNTKDYFDGLVKKSKINIDANKESCGKYYAKVEEKNHFEKKVKSTGVLKSFLIFLAVVFYLAMVVGILTIAVPQLKIEPIWIPIILIVGGVLLGTGVVLIICLVVNKKFKSHKATVDKVSSEINELEIECWNQMSKLNILFEWGTPQMLFESTLPLIKMDRIFTPGRQDMLFKKYGYVGTDENESVVVVQSGSILGNPFALERVFYTYMGTQVYTGSIVITWTTWSTDANGHSVSHHHSQTLTASLTKPKPFYDYDTRLVCGNDAAPNLSFDRKSTNKDLASMSEKKINKMVKKSEKKLNKLVKKDDSFTQMSNSKFEALFTSTNRDNETEYRLLFTPIAQQNIIDLLTSQPYGDDFDFSKAGPINLVRSKHSQRFDYQASPFEFANFDYELIEKHFNEYCNRYFQSFYFDLAPILSIPLYQQHKALEYIYKTSDGVTNYEIESLVNGYGSKYFAHPSTETDCILKCNKIVNSKGKVNTTIDCYSYKTVEHTTLVPVRGGDGHMHNVPVIWYKYIPIMKSTPITVLDVYGHSLENPKQTVESIYKNFGIKSIYKQKGISLHMGGTKE